MDLAAGFLSILRCKKKNDKNGINLHKNLSPFIFALFHFYYYSHRCFVCLSAFLTSQSRTLEIANAKTTHRFSSRKTMLITISFDVTRFQILCSMTCVPHITITATLYLLLVAFAVLTSLHRCHWILVWSLLDNWLIIWRERGRKKRTLDRA